jgi:hypothetical protein
MYKYNMAFVNVGGKRSSSFTVNIMHSGSPHIDVSLQNDLLPGDAADWLVGVESLSAPLDSTRFLDENHKVLFYLRRIQHGVAPSDQTQLLRNSIIIADSQFDAAVMADFQRWTHDACQLRHNRTPCLEFGDLMEQMVEWCASVNTLLNTVGLNRADIGGPPIIPQNLFNSAWDIRNAPAAGNAARKIFRHLRVRVGPSGMLSIIGSRLFWANFIIDVSPYMQALTGLTPHIGVNINTDQVISGLTVAGGNVNYLVDLTAGGGVGAEWNNPVSYEMMTITGNLSLWGSCDTRLSISVATDLPLQRSLTITDDKQCRDFTVGSFDLNNEVTVSTEIADQITSVFTVQSQSRAGHTALKKSGPPNYWVALKPAVNIRQLRVRLMIRERVWDLTTDQWRIVHKNLPMERHQTWQCCLIFAKKTH